jgi:hypothetical protein
MPRYCAMCYSTSFRLSKIRRADIKRLLVLQYPVRCVDCLWRAFVFLPLALRYRANQVRGPREKPQKA